MHLMPHNAGELANIVGIDPGTEHLGLSCITFNVVTLGIHQTAAQVFVGSKLGISSQQSLVHSARFARIDAHRENLTSVLRALKPVAVVCESPFFNSMRPQAYGALVEIVNAIRYAVWEYDPQMPLDLLDPPRVKRSVGAAGNAKKDVMQQAVLGLSELNFQGPVPLTELDEHSIDAIAVGYSKLIGLRKGTDVL